MCIERTSAFAFASAINNRVELLPQSKAATTSPTNVLTLKRTELERGRHEITDGIIGTGQKIREMCVQTLDARAGAAHTPRSLYEIGANRGPFASARVVVVGAL
jgi:hypothetical protein